MMKMSNFVNNKNKNNSNKKCIAIVCCMLHQVIAVTLQNKNVNVLNKNDIIRAAPMVGKTFFVHNLSGYFLGYKSVTPERILETTEESMAERYSG